MPRLICHVQEEKRSTTRSEMIGVQGVVAIMLHLFIVRVLLIQRYCMYSLLVVGRWLAVSYVGQRKELRRDVKI
jgi:ethanolamine transporter EutH